MNVFCKGFYFVLLINCISFSLALQNKPTKQFNAGQDAQDLRKAIEGIGTDENKILSIIPERSPAEREAIARAYYQLYEKHLIKDLKQDISGHFQMVIVALMEKPNEYLAKELFNALSGVISVDYHAISQILCTREKQEIESLMETFKFMFNKTLLTMIDETATGDYNIFLKTLVTPPIRERASIKRDRITTLLQYIPSLPGNCDMERNTNLLDMMAKESYEQLRHVIREYEDKNNGTIEGAFEKFCENPIKDAYVTTAEYAKSSANYYAKELSKAMVGIGTDDKTLIRIIVGRKYIDLDEIKALYKVKYHTPLTQSVAAETSGHYRKTLLALIGEEK